jgi:uncharacterized membrane protein
MTELRIRSLAKGLTWRITASVTTAVLVYLYTGDLTLTAQISFFEVTSKLLLYYGHERLWGRVAWGLVRRVARQK